MALTTLRSTLLPVNICKEKIFQHYCLAHLSRRPYVTSSDRATKTQTLTPTTILAKKSDFAQPPKKTDEPTPFETSKCKGKTVKALSPTIHKLQIMQEKKKEAVSKVRKNVSGYMFTRFFDYVKNYDIVLKKNVPSALKLYRVFVDGVKDFFSDMKRYLKISRIVNSSEKGLGSLNRQELELYMQMPRDMIKVAPTLIFSSLPIVGYAVLPLVFMFPRSFLTSHFWTLQQKAEFKQYYLHERLTYNKPVFRCLQSKLKFAKKDSKYQQFKNILGQIGSGTHPTVEQILDINDIFAKPPYSLVSLSGKHITLLNKLHGIRSSWFKRHSLYDHGCLVLYMDQAIRREGGVHNMPFESMRNACYIRGLNPVNLSADEMIEWLRCWIKISNTIKVEQITLLLHLPIFLGYNHPNNWQLIYGKDNKK